MGRLAVILGSNALGPGGEEIAAAAAEHGAAIVQRHGARRRPTSSPTRSTTPPTCGRWSSRAATGCWRSPRSARCAPICRSARLLCPDDFIALQVADSIFADARAHSAPGFAPRWRGEVLAAWAEGGEAPVDGGVYWQTIGPRFETPAEIRMIAAARRRGRDDDRLRVRDRGRARARVRGDLRRRQPRQRARPRASSTSPRWRPTGWSTRRRLRDGLAAVLPRLGAVGPVSAGARSPVTDGAVLDGERVGAALRRTGRSPRSAPRSSPRPARRRSTPAARSSSRRWSTATPTRR